MGHVTGSILNSLRRPLRTLPPPVRAGTLTSAALAHPSVRAPKLFRVFVKIIGELFWWSEKCEVAGLKAGFKVWTDVI